MAYTPNPQDITQPTEDKFVVSAAAEFRALKKEVQDALALPLPDAARMVRAPIGETLIELPNAAARANTQMLFDAAGQPMVGTVVPGSAADVLLQLADPIDISKGDALVMVRRMRTSALARTQHSVNEDHTSAFDFMTEAQIADVKARTHLFDLTPALQAFFDACENGEGYMPPGWYRHDLPLYARNQMTVRGAGYQSTVLLTFNDIEQLRTVDAPAWITATDYVVGDLVTESLKVYKALTDHTAGVFATDLGAGDWALYDGSTYWVTMSDMTVANHLPVTTEPGPGFVGTTTAGGDQITDIADTSMLNKGINVTGAGLPAGTYIRRVLNGNTIQLGDYKGDVVTATAAGAGVAFSTFYRQGPTKFQFHLYNPGGWLLDRMMFHTKIGDVDYSPNSHAGVWWDRTPGFGSFINTTRDVLFNHAQHLMGCSDSDIINCDHWGNPFDYSLKMSGPGCQMIGGSISAGVKCGLWTSGSPTEQSGGSNHNLTGVNFDAGDIWYTGYGAIMESPVGVIIAGGCRFNNIRKAGVYIMNSVGCKIDAMFLNTNMDGGGFSDVEVVSTIFQTVGLVVSGVAFQSFAKAPETGYCVREMTGPFFPAFCNYSGLTVNGPYKTPYIRIESNIANDQYATMHALGGYPNMRGNLALEAVNPRGGIPGQIGYGDGGLLLQMVAEIPPLGTLDFPINNIVRDGSPPGFVGILTVSCYRPSFPAQNRSQIFVVLANAGVLTQAQLTGALHDGSGGGIPFTIDMNGAGVLRLTLQYPDAPVSVHMTFHGTKHWGT